MTRTITINEIVDPSQARVVEHVSACGDVIEAHFDLSGLPRVDGVLTGRPVADVPKLVERLCGICPVAHHLAGVAALEALWGPVELTPTVALVRRLLNHGSVIATHAMSYLALDQAAVMTLRRFGQLAMAAAGSPKHFPTTAIPGGVAASVDHGAVLAMVSAASDALDAATGLARRLLDDNGSAYRSTSTESRRARGGAFAANARPFAGADVALVDKCGHIDLLGAYLRAVAPDGTVIVSGARPQQWPGIVCEAVPGAAAPQLYLTELGPDKGIYRTGPVAQLRVGSFDTPEAAALQAEWRDGSQRAVAARAILMTHCVEACARIAADPVLLSADIGAPLCGESTASEGVGWIESGRGLLVHRYISAADGTMAAAAILTPTAQNERWLADLLTRAAGVPDRDDARLAMEDAIREADPCLPCTNAAAGEMGLTVAIVEDVENGAGACA